MFVALDDKLKPICAVLESEDGKRYGEPITFQSKLQALGWIKSHRELIKDSKYTIVPLNTYLESVKQRKISSNG